MTTREKNNWIKKKSNEIYNQAIDDFLAELRCPECNGECGRVVCPFVEISLGLKKG